MKYATFITEVDGEHKLQIPTTVREKLRIEPGDRVEVSLKKIKSRRLDLILAENPLYKLLDLTRSPESSSRDELQGEERA
ncbi:MAG: hypothetical protein D6681_06280 [Calditrichaeota bacterium]|nr:MAG: hypothetical protein D6681_06280 [Calditrichota bacterium]